MWGKNVNSNWGYHKWRSTLRKDPTPRPKLSKTMRIKILVPKKGLEPPHPCGYMDLNHARLPIPPLRHGWKRVKTLVGQEAKSVYTERREIRNVGRSLFAIRSSLFVKSSQPSRNCHPDRSSVAAPPMDLLFAGGARVPPPQANCRTFHSGGQKQRTCAH